MDLYSEGVVGIDYDIREDLSGSGFDQISEVFNGANPGLSANQAGGPVGMLHRIVNLMQIGDGVVTYDPGSRIYWIGTISSGYSYIPEPDAVLPHRRQVNWINQSISRDDLSVAARNSLGSTLALFTVSDEIWAEFISLHEGTGDNPRMDEEDQRIELQQARQNVAEEAIERLKDQVAKLNPEEMEELLAALLRAMGFRTRVSPKGPDRGVDVMASPDGLGLQEPRIKCEVKHRRGTQMGAQNIRAFIGALRQGDRGIYLSTGGFSREARYESDRANVPLTLLDLDDLARLIETHYASFDTEGRALLPLTRIYWPVE